MSKQDESVNFLENINGLYGSNTYLEKNGMSVIITAVIFTIVFSIITYSEISNHLSIIKQDWTEYRCKPQYIPLAGIINAPKGTSKWNYTTKNFEFCINSMLGDLTSFITNPTNIFTSLLTASMEVVHAIMKTFSEFISTIRSHIIKFAQDVIARILNLIVPITELWHKIYDILKRSSGVMGFIFYFVDLIFFTIISWINLIIKVITDWVLFIFEILGITGLVLLLPLIFLMFNIILAIIAELFALSTIMAGEAMLPHLPWFGIPMIAGGGISMIAVIPWLVGVIGTYSIVALASFISLAIIIIVIQLYELFIIDPMMDLLDLLPGFIQTPPDKNMGDAMWWANTLNLTKDFTKPMKFKTTADVKKQQSKSKTLQDREGFRNKFY